jgi:hypothetical protein
MVRFALSAAMLGLLPLSAAAQPIFPLDPSSESSHEDSATSFDGTNFLVVYTDDRGILFNYELYGTMVSPSGQVLSQTPLMVSSGPYTGYPDACASGGQHFVVYEAAWGGGAIPQVRGTRVLSNGTVLDADGIEIFSNEQTANAFRPQVATNGQKYCVVWGDDLLYPGQMPLQFALVRFDGTRELGPVNIPGSDTASLLSQDLTSDGTNFILAWEGEFGMMVTRISPTGQVLGTQLIHASNNHWMDVTKIGFNGEGFLVSWYWWPEGDPTLSAKRVTLTGAGTGTLLTIPGGGSVGIPFSILRSGSEFVLFSVGANPSISAPQLEYTRISSAGQIVEPATVYLSGPDLRGFPSVAMGQGGTVLSAAALAFGVPYPARMHGQVLSLGAASSCYANCDGSTAAPQLTANDFACFLNRFAAAEPYADCDGVGGLTANDFACFLTRYVQGCP